MTARIPLLTLLFVAAAAATVAWSASMAGMLMIDDAPSAASFLGMWALMTVAMMLPCAAPALLRATRPAAVAVGYFAVWVAAGALALPVTAALAVAEMRWPPLAGAAVAVAGAYQLTGFKSRRLACCRKPGAAATWRQGARLARHCLPCCAGLMLALLAIGMTNVWAMAAMAAALIAERLAPAGHRIARATGVLTIAAGLFLMIRPGVLA